MKPPPAMAGPMGSSRARRIRYVERHWWESIRLRHAKTSLLQLGTLHGLGIGLIVSSALANRFVRTPAEWTYLSIAFELLIATLTGAPLIREFKLKRVDGTRSVAEASIDRMAAKAKRDAVPFTLVFTSLGLGVKGKQKEESGARVLDERLWDEVIAKEMEHRDRYTALFFTPSGLPARNEALAASVRRVLGEPFDGNVLEAKSAYVQLSPETNEPMRTIVVQGILHAEGLMDEDGKPKFALEPPWKKFVRFENQDPLGQVRERFLISEFTVIERKLSTFRKREYVWIEMIRDEEASEWLTDLLRTHRNAELDHDAKGGFSAFRLDGARIETRQFVKEEGKWVGRWKDMGRSLKTATKVFEDRHTEPKDAPDLSRADIDKILEPVDSRWHRFVFEWVGLGLTPNVSKNDFYSNGLLGILCGLLAAAVYAAIWDSLAHLPLVFGAGAAVGLYLSNEVGLWALWWSQERIRERHHGFRFRCRPTYREHRKEAKEDLVLYAWVSLGIVILFGVLDVALFMAGLDSVSLGNHLRDLLVAR